MITHNTTFVLSAHDEQALIDYLRRVYVPHIVAQSTLSSPHLMRIEPHQGAEEEAISLALSFRAESRAELDASLAGAVAEAQSELYGHFGERVLCFATTMQDISLGD